MLDRRSTWLPQVLGATFLLLAIEKVRWLVRPPDYSIEFVMGILLTGRLAWIASALLAILWAWISAACFRRRNHAVWAVAGAAIYTAVSVWVWQSLYSNHSRQAVLITSTFISAMALAFCRFLIDRRDQFGPE
jgi:hypothetical protein